MSGIYELAGNWITWGKWEGMGCHCEGAFFATVAISNVMVEIAALRSR